MLIHDAPRAFGIRRIRVLDTIDQDPGRGGSGQPVRRRNRIARLHAIVQRLFQAVRAGRQFRGPCPAIDGRFHRHPPLDRLAILRAEHEFHSVGRPRAFDPGGDRRRIAQVDGGIAGQYLDNPHTRRPGGVGPRRQQPLGGWQRVVGRENLVGPEQHGGGSQGVTQPNRGRKIDGGGRIDLRDIVRRPVFDGTDHRFGNACRLLSQQQVIDQPVPQGWLGVLDQPRCVHRIDRAEGLPSEMADHVPNGPADERHKQRPPADRPDFRHPVVDRHRRHDKEHGGEQAEQQPSGKVGQLDLPAGSRELSDDPRRGCELGSHRN